MPSFQPQQPRPNITVFYFGIISFLHVCAIFTISANAISFIFYISNRKMAPITLHLVNRASKPYRPFADEIFYRGVKTSHSNTVQHVRRNLPLR